MFRENERISPRQLMTLMFIVLLPVESRTLPGRMAEAAGEASWLSPLLAALPTCLLVLIVIRLVCPAPGRWRGLDEAFRAALGPAAGKLLCGVYLLWLLFLIWVLVRMYAERFLNTTYAGTPPALFFAVLLALCAHVARGRLDALARVNQIFFYILTGSVALILLLALPDVELYNVLPVWTYDLPRAARGGLSFCSGVSLPVYLAFLAGGVNGETCSRRRALSWLGGACLLAAALQFVFVGVFGSGLAARMQMPFFSLAKQIDLFETFGRFEAVNISLWVLTDLTLVGSLLLAVCVLLQRQFSMRDGRAAVFPLALLAMAGAMLVAGDVFSLARFAGRVIQPVNLILGYLVPAAVWLIGEIRKKAGGEDLEAHGKTHGGEEENT